ncbi:hypothetical protein, conserved [Babesia bigemina]|nr:hypothetical protein, conserved [Babesia bigemina]CDR71699.1 hypothetical protein, conserved [Babesia bigemina]|eukprot:XP_012770645.1 hypothetical protein, conserved [Babesia bigemina]
MSKLKGDAEQLCEKIAMFLSDTVGKTDRDTEAKSGTLYRELNDLLTHVKELGRKFNDVKKKCRAVDETLTQWTSKAAEQLSSAKLKANHAINKVANEMKNKITDDLHAVIQKVQNVYQRTMETKLEELKSDVDAQFDKIRIVINDDLESGVKGLLRKLHTNCERIVANDVSVEALSSAFQTVIGPLKDHVDIEVKRLNKESNDKSNPVKHHNAKYADELNQVYRVLRDLLNHITTKKGYDYLFPRLLDELMNAVNRLTPQDFADPNTAILDGIRVGLVGFVNEMRKVYINMYDGATPIDKWETEDPKKKKKEANKDAAENMILTKDGRNGARICVTIMYMIYQQLHELYYFGGKKWKDHKIQGEADRIELERHLRRVGYDVSNLITKDGTGWNVAVRLAKGFVRHNEFNKYPTEFKSLDASMGFAKNHGGLLTQIFEHLETYNAVSHMVLQPKPRSPCNAYEMCIWLTGLPYRPVYDAMLHDVLPSLLENPDKQAKDDDGLEIPLVDSGIEPVTAYPHDITYDGLVTSLHEMCSKSYDVLACIVGTGDAATYYACQYCDNSFNLRYPSDPASCLDMLLDILRRLLPALRFLSTQCSLDAEHGGWQQCEYGKVVPSGKSRCKDHSSDEATCQPKCKANTKANCQPTSPLQSYLNDCLPGHLPHQLADIGCKSKCTTCPAGKPGMPCVTPLGFRAFSGSTKTGKAICDILEDLLKNNVASLLSCLLPRPPSTLAEHFGFALSVVKGWKLGVSADKKGMQSHIESSIDKVSISLYSKPNELTDALSKIYGISQKRNDHSHRVAEPADLSTLSMDQSCMLANEDNVHCGPYLQILCSDSYCYLAKKHSDLYLSWAVDLPWSLYSYLKSLFDSYSSISCQDWGCSRCVDGISCRPGKHGDGYSCRCRSLVRCRGVLSTLYNYGFTFGDAKKLLSDTERRYCRNLYAQLQNVLKSQHFTKLFEECDNFIWTIREPFTYLVLALWSLSLFYLICVMVGRLDVLHIRSHLRIPSSHKITAQSLLAAAQVGRLAKISYLQP